LDTVRNRKILVFNNNSETLDLLVKSLRSLNASVEVKPPTRLPTGDFLGVVISGGALPRERYKEILNLYKSFLASTEIPVLGICLGMRILGYCHGARIRRMPEIEEGIVEVKFHKDYPLAPGYGRLKTQQNHLYELVCMPLYLTNYGSSAKCRIQAVKHQSKPQFGVQFHPEIDGTSDGYIILENFLNLCLKEGDVSISE